MAKGNGKANSATLSTAKIFIDVKENPLTAYTINGNNYFKLRDLAAVMNFGVTWDNATSTIGIDTNLIMRSKPRYFYW